MQDDAPSSEPPPHEISRADIATGSIAAAAHVLGIAETTARQQLSGLYRRTGCLNAAQAACWLGMFDDWESSAWRGRPTEPQLAPG